MTKVTVHEKQRVNEEQPNPAAAHHTITTARRPDNILSSALVQSRSTKFMACPSCEPRVDALKLRATSWCSEYLEAHSRYVYPQWSKLTEYRQVRAHGVMLRRHHLTGIKTIDVFQNDSYLREFSNTKTCPNLLEKLSKGQYLKISWLTPPKKMYFVWFKYQIQYQRVQTFWEVTVLVQAYAYWCCVDYIIRNSLVSFLKALFNPRNDIFFSRLQKLVRGHIEWGSAKSLAFRSFVRQKAQNVSTNTN